MVMRPMKKIWLFLPRPISLWAQSSKNDMQGKSGLMVSAEVNMASTEGK